MCEGVCVCVYIYTGDSRRWCQSDSEWGEPDIRGCISLRAQQLLIDADSIHNGQVMNIHELLYSLSDIISYTDISPAAEREGGVSGGDLGSVGRYLSVMVQQLVERTLSGPVTATHHLLLEVC